ncbi:Vacuolar protein sorting-associated protein 17 [Basidiobolus ranarum]|uniref:Vacuolar protein sorting-associated protein 17 n=1 Tax=Basidiobolus ranarum TaxID=34480 RepID=A0ABR2WRH1_9FUNG
MSSCANTPFVSGTPYGFVGGNSDRIIELESPKDKWEGSKPTNSSDYSYLLPNFLSSGHLHSTPTACPTPALSPPVTKKLLPSEPSVLTTPIKKGTSFEISESIQDEVEPFYSEAPELSLKFELLSVEKDKKEFKIRFNVKTNIPQYGRNHFYGVERSYVEFEKLQKYLTNAYPECIVPLLPLKGVDLIEENFTKILVKNAFHRYLSRLSEHPILRKDNELQFFVETDFAYMPRIKTGTLKSTRFRTKASKDSLDPLDTAYESLINFEKAIIPCSKSVNKLQSAKKLLVNSKMELGQKLSSWSGNEKDVLLSRSLDEFTSALEMSLGITQTQSECETGYLSYLFEQHLQGTLYVKTLLQNSLVVEKEYERSAENLEKKRQALIILKASGINKIDQVQSGIDNYEEAKQFESYKKAQFHKVDRLLHTELGVNEKARASDFYHHLGELARQTVKAERAKLNAWKGVLDGLK